MATPFSAVLLREWLFCVTRARVVRSGQCRYWCAWGLLLTRLILPVCWQEPLVQSGGVDLLCELTRSEDPDIRLNGIWGLMVSSGRPVETR